MRHATRQVTIAVRLGSEEVSILAYGQGKTDLHPDHMTDEEIKDAVMTSLIQRVDLLRQAWLENGGEPYAT